MQCPNCGTKNNDNNRFCKKCGKPLPSPVAAAPQPPPSPANEKKKLNPSLKAVIILAGIFVLLLTAFFIALATGILQITTAATTTTLPPETTPGEVAAQPPTTEEPPATTEPVFIPTLNTNAQLKDAGAWLVYVNMEKGIMAVNSDGGGPNPVFPMPLHSLVAGTFDIPIGINPYFQDYLALRVERGNRPGWDLVLVHLPDLTTKTIAPLISDQNLQGITSNNDVDIDLQMAILEQNAIRWSPNGRYLAFAAAIDGPSSDLYIYDMEKDQLTRLSSGSLHVATPYWTLDSKQVFYQAVETFGRGAGWYTKSTWAVDLATQTSRHLYDFTDDTSSVTPLGITRDNFILLDTFSQSNPDLRLVDLATGAVNILATGGIQAVNMNHSTGSVVFVDESGCINLIPKPTDTPECTGTVMGEILSVTPDDIVQGFTISTKEGTFAIDQNGAMATIFEQPGILTRSTANGLMCFSGDTLVCGFGSAPTELHTVTDAPYVKVLLSVGSDFFFVDSYALYYVSSDNWTPILIDDNLKWVNYSSSDFQFDDIGWLAMPG